VELPRCYYETRGLVESLGLNTVFLVARLIGETFNVEAELPRVRFEMRPEPFHTYTPLGQRIWARGGYDPFSQRFILAGPDWCWKTLVHETFTPSQPFTGMGISGRKLC